MKIALIDRAGFIQTVYDLVWKSDNVFEGNCITIYPDSVTQNNMTIRLDCIEWLVEEHDYELYINGEKGDYISLVTIILEMEER